MKRYISYWEAEYLREGKEWQQDGLTAHLKSMAYLARKQSEHMQGTRIEGKWRNIAQWCTRTLGAN